jgi:signal transduction histidine kinase
MGDTPEEIANDVRAVGRIGAVPSLLQVLCETTGMGFAAVARVTDETWTACAVADGLEFGLQPGGQLAVNTTLCIEARASRTPIVIDHASTDPAYRDHHTPRIYGIESYVSVPIILASGRYFGNLCAIDPKPANVTDPRIVSMFKRFAQIIALQLDSELVREEERAELLDERASSELREQFIAILGHDLRNPLQAVYASGELLERRLTDPVLVGIASRIKVNVRRMSGLIDDVLDFARGRLGPGLGIELADVEGLETSLSAVVKELQDAKPERRIVADFDINRPVRCDVGRVQQVASNLLANAFTHGSPLGAVRISAAIDHQHLVLQVHNDGDPIPAESIEKIFEPFWRHSTSESRQGLGLGLYICSQIVKAHGGQLSVTSLRESGTTFTVRLPLEGVAPAADLAPSHTRYGNTPTANPRPL